MAQLLMRLEKNADIGSGRESRALDADLTQLLRWQNVDGGWGYYARKESRVEPTVWTLLALLALDGSAEMFPARERALQYLVGAQLEDGSWPAAAQQVRGAWVTAVACLAIQQASGPTESLRRAATYLCNAWPRDGAWWSRMAGKLFRKSSVSRQNIGYRGWSWTAGTSSWVEPTACALIALHNLPSDLLPKNFSKRRKLAEAMLKDRMCPGGGWNSGNPMVYGVPGIPNVDMTCFALLALMWSSNASVERDAGLRWLNVAVRETRGAKSRAMADFCLTVYGYPASDRARCESGEEAGEDILANAWTILARTATPNWVRTIGTSEIHL